MTIIVRDPSHLPDAVGETATGTWFTIDQDRIGAFADATEDRQWIHVDEELAAAGPFGSTIAHGFLTLSLIPRLTDGLFEVGEARMSVNYGSDRVRFLQPVPSGSRVRAAIEVVSADESPQGWRVTQRTTVEIEGTDRPALVADLIALYSA